MFLRKLFLFYFFISSSFFLLDSRNRYVLANKPEMWVEIPLSGYSLSDQIPIINRNIEGYQNELAELNRYIPLIESSIEDYKNYSDDFSAVEGELKALKDRVNFIKQRLSDLFVDIRESSKGIISGSIEQGKLEIEKEKIAHKIELYFKYIFDKNNLIKTGSLGASLILSAMVSYFGSKFVYAYLKYFIMAPKLVRESSRITIYDIVKNYLKYNLLGSVPPKRNFDDIILPEKLKESLSSLATDTKLTYQNRLPFRNILFWGAPGTGKTMFARRLAEYSGMDYAILSGADFSQFSRGRAIEELHRFFDWAERSKKGLVVFIDEADSFLGNRKNLDKNGYDLVNAFLSRTGTSSRKLMFIFATNYPELLDPAVLSRIHKKIYFPLPSYNERVEIIKLYLDKYIINDRRIITEHNFYLEKKITSEIDVRDVEEAARKMRNFSGRDIEQVISEMQIRSYTRGNGILSKELFFSIINEKITENNLIKNKVN